MFEKYRADVEHELADFQRYLASFIPPLKICHGYDQMYYADEWEAGCKDGKWLPGGVYIYYDIDGKVLNVGLTIRGFYSRLPQKKVAEAETVRLIPFPEEYLFLAAALEAFLISRLAPPENKSWKNVYTPPLPTA